MSVKSIKSTFSAAMATVFPSFCNWWSRRNIRAKRLANIRTLWLLCWNILIEKEIVHEVKPLGCSRFYSKTLKRNCLQIAKHKSLRSRESNWETRRERPAGPGILCQTERLWPFERNFLQIESCIAGCQGNRHSKGQRICAMYADENRAKPTTN